MIYRNGLEVSSYNGKMNWAKARDKGIEFVTIRFLVGAGPFWFNNNLVDIDPECIANIEGAEAEGIKISLYNVPKPASGGVKLYGQQHLDWFFKKYDEYFGSDSVLDYPVTDDAELAKGQDMRHCTAVHEVYLEGLEGFMGHPFPIVYTNWWWEANIFQHDKFLKYILHAASWTEGDYPWIPLPWRSLPRDERWGIWQHWVGKDGPEFGASSKEIDHNRWNPLLPFPDNAPPPPPPPPVHEWPETISAFCTMDLEGNVYESDSTYQKVN